jgi:hypothetical protein
MAFGTPTYAGANPTTFLQSLSQPAGDPQGTVFVGGATGATGTTYAYGTAQATGTGPQAPLKVVGWQQVVLNGTTYWVPLMQ